MPIFTRSASGMRNTPIFYGVSFTVYTEGRINCSIEDVIAGTAGAESGPDVQFWNVLFRKFAPNLHCHFRAIGGKMNVIEMARRTESSGVTNVVLCLDADHQHRRGKEVDRANVLYTFGYSWENDVLMGDVLLDVHDQLCIAPRSRKSHHEMIKGFQAQFVRRAKRLVQLDVLYLLKYGYLPLASVRSHVLNRSNPQQGWNVGAFYAELRSLGTGRPRPAQRFPHLHVDVDREANGHFRFDYCFDAFRSMAHQACGIARISQTIFSSLLIDRFAASLKGRKPLVRFHREQFRNLDAHIADLGLPTL